MLWLFVLLIAIVATLPLSGNSSSKDINFYKNGMAIYHEKSKNNDTFKNL
jgi:hypothetical protein